MANAIMFDDSVDLSNYVDLTSAQTISGLKTYTEHIKLGLNKALLCGPTGTTLIGTVDNKQYDLLLRAAQNVIIRTGNNYSVYPYVNNNSSLGNSDHKWKNLYLAGNLTDGTNTITIANIGSRPIQGATAPTTSTAADYLGQEYIDTTNGDMYRCTAITAQGTTPETYEYTWRQLAFVV